MKNQRQLREPQEGDLIYVKRPTSGVLVLGDPTQYKKTSWSSTIITIDPNQTALILKVYSISPKLRDQIEKGDRILPHTTTDPLDIHATHDATHYHYLIIIAIGNHVIETLFDPDYIDIIGSSDSTHMAR